MSLKSKKRRRSAVDASAGERNRNSQLIQPRPLGKKGIRSICEHFSRHPRHRGREVVSNCSMRNAVDSFDVTTSNVPADGGNRWRVETG